MVFTTEGLFEVAIESSYTFFCNAIQIYLTFQSYTVT